MNTPAQEYQELLEQLHKWAAFMLANVLWVFAALPLVTLPAATAGLTVVMTEWVRGSRPEPLQAFFTGFRTYGWRATMVVLIDLLVAVPLVLNLAISLAAAPEPLMVMARGLTIGALLALAATNIYLWPLLVMLELPLPRLWRVAVRVLFINPWPALLSLLACTLIVGSSLFLPKAFMLLFTVSAVAFTCCFGAWRGLRPYLHDVNGKLECS